MKRDEIFSVLYDIMKNHLELPTISKFHEHARLNDDLFMDSILILQLILHLEVHHQFEIPDEMIVARDFQTVGSLVSLLERILISQSGGVQ
ncbi:petrobactin biosynthesis protein AsbD [Robertmurraya sp.]|uniref:petrobactin biosynthesis protein AsbD n=1 Tax=Robertmurraya sp. TaxID=2837525 RepID=UPI0037039358